MMLGMPFHEGQTVALTADARISDVAFVATGSYGYVEQVTTKAPVRHKGWEAGGHNSMIIVLVHFRDQGLKVWVPKEILEEAEGS